MRNQKNIPQNHEMTVSTEGLQKTQLLLTTLGFDLFEIWKHESGETYEVWKSQKSTVRLNVSEEKSLEDASRSDIVTELDYLFWELRAIKNTLQDHVYLSDMDELEQERTPQQEFEVALNSMRDMQGFEEPEKSFLFKKHVDPILLAYLSMDQDQRKSIQH
jgi:hypothetical protein